MSEFTASNKTVAVLTALEVETRVVLRHLGSFARDCCTNVSAQYLGISNVFGVSAMLIGGGSRHAECRRRFEKTGGSRQVELVKLVAGFSTPLAA